MSKFLTDEQKMYEMLGSPYLLSPFKSEATMVEYGATFIRFKDKESGKTFEVRVKEIKPKKKK